MEYSKDQLKVFDSQKVIWILFNNLKCGKLIRTKNAHLYEREIHPTWTPIESISKDIQIGSNFSHIIKTQFSIQLATTCTIHWTQGLTFDYLTFDPISVYKHSLRYTTFFCVKKKGKNLPFTTFPNEKSSNWSQCCHGVVPIANDCTMGCTYVPKPHTFHD